MFPYLHMYQVSVSPKTTWKSYLGKYSIFSTIAWYFTHILIFWSQEIHDGSVAYRTRQRAIYDRFSELDARTEMDRPSVRIATFLYCKLQKWPFLFSIQVPCAPRWPCRRWYRHRIPSFRYKHGFSLFFYTRWSQPGIHGFCVSLVIFAACCCTPLT